MRPCQLHLVLSVLRDPNGVPKLRGGFLDVSPTLVDQACYDEGLRDCGGGRISLTHRFGQPRGQLDPSRIDIRMRYEDSNIRRELLQRGQVETGGLRNG